jgi:hypothetical protein
MNRLALTAALATLCSGCWITTADSVGSVNVYWDFRRDAPAQAGGHVFYDSSFAAVNVNGICPESGVDTVLVESEAGRVDLDCTGPVGGGNYVQGLVVDGLLSGNTSITVTGFRSGTAVYRSTAPVTVLGGSVVSLFVDVAGIQAPLEARGDLAFGDPAALYPDCAAAGAPNLDIELHDSFGTLVDHLVSGCSDPLPSLAYNDLVDLDNYTIRLRGKRVSDGALVFDACNKPFDHFGTDTGANAFTATLLTLPVPTCP